MTICSVEPCQAPALHVTNRGSARENHWCDPHYRAFMQIQAVFMVRGNLGTGPVTKPHQTTSKRTGFEIKKGA